MKITLSWFLLLLLITPPSLLAQTNYPILLLADAEKIALQNHPRIAAANDRALAAQEATKDARSDFFPKLNLYADAVGADSDNARVLAGGINNPSIYDRVSGGAAVSQLITDFGRTANRMAGYKYQAQAANQNTAASREQILLGVEQTYLWALEAQAVLKVTRQTLETRLLLLNQVTLLASNQLKSELDVSFARVAAEEARLLVQKAGNDADAAMASLSTALGYREMHTFQLMETTPSFVAITNDVSTLVETALARRPELLSLRAQQNAALRLADSERDSRLPEVQAVGMAGNALWRDSHLPDHYAVGGIQLSLPLFAGGSLLARQHEAELTAKAETELLRSAENDVVRDVHIAWFNANNAREQIPITQVLETNAAEAYTLAKARYQVGSSSIVELSQAQLNLTSAQIAEANARYNLLIQEANLDYQIAALH